jgi:DNA-binding transcriptional ArsR family regulator
MGMDATLAALAQPRRRQILKVLGGSELSAGDIARRFDVTRPAISQHLAVLRAAGLVSERRAGTRRFYRARPEGAAELRAWLDSFWREGLGRLKAEAELEARKR